MVPSYGRDSYTRLRKSHVDSRARNLLALFFLISSLLIAAMLLLPIQSAFAYDCAKDVPTPPGATVGGVGIPYDINWNERHPTLDFRLTSDPLILNTASSSTPDGMKPSQAILLRFFNSQTNETMKNIGYSVNISRITDSNAELGVLNSTSFFSYTGMQAFAIEPSPPPSSSTTYGSNNATSATSTTVYAGEMSFPHHLVPKPGGWIVISSSELLQKGERYHAHIEIESVDNELCILPKGKIVTFDAYWPATDGGTTSDKYTVAYSVISPTSIPEFPLSLMMLALSVAAMIGFSLVYQKSRFHTLGSG